jgi:MYXO-CTERM domain-containing protein
LWFNLHSYIYNLKGKIKMTTLKQQVIAGALALAPVFASAATFVHSFTPRDLNNDGQPDVFEVVTSATQEPGILTTYTYRPFGLGENSSATFSDFTAAFGSAGMSHLGTNFNLPTGSEMTAGATDIMLHALCGKTGRVNYSANCDGAAALTNMLGATVPNEIFEINPTNPSAAWLFNLTQGWHVDSPVDYLAGAVGVSITTSPVTEPGTLGTMGLGALGVAAAATRRRKAESAPAPQR